MRRLVLLLLALSAVPAPAVALADSPDYDRGLALGAQAYDYGIPLVDVDRIFRSGTSVNVPDGAGRGPVNHFNHVRKLADASEKTVNAPNNDTPYSMASLDLRREPQVLHAPPIRNRFWEFELVDPWTNNFFNITSAHRKLGAGDFGVTRGGDWAVVGPHFRGRVPKGVRRVRSPYDRVWIIGRTYLRDRADLANVHRIQDQYSIKPLSKFGRPYTSPRPRHPDRTPEEARVPGSGPQDDPLAFYVALDRLMVRFPPPAADHAILQKLRAIGVGRGLDPRRAGLSADTLRGMRDAVRQAPNRLLAALVQLLFRHFDDHNGYYISDLGNWGTDYEGRAIGDRVGVGGQRASIATYPFTAFDAAKAPLTGSKQYVLHIPANRWPIPVRAFWSLTLYDANSFFVPNPLNRYLLNSRSPLSRNSDGSIDIYIQHDRPATTAQVANWLPAPAAGQGFRLIWRLYDLDSALAGVLDGTGWQPPRVQPCDSMGVGLDGTACAPPAPAGTASRAVAAACRAGGTLRAPTHHPKTGRLWPIVVTETPRGARTSARYDFLFQGQRVRSSYPFYNKHFHFKTRFRDRTIRWPKDSVGYPLTFRVVLHNRCGTKKLDYKVTVRR